MSDSWVSQLPVEVAIGDANPPAPDPALAYVTQIPIEVIIGDANPEMSNPQRPFIILVG